MEKLDYLVNYSFFFFWGNLLVNHSLTQFVDLGNHHTHLLRLGEDPNGTLLQRALYLNLVIEK